MNLLRVMIIASLFLVPLPTLALGGSDEGTIKRIGAKDGLPPARAYLWKVEGRWTTLIGCYGVDTRTAVIDLTTDAGKLLYTTALSAFLAGKLVKLWANGCIEENPDDSAAPKYPRVIRIDINP